MSQFTAFVLILLGTAVFILAACQQGGMPSQLDCTILVDQCVQSCPKPLCRVVQCTDIGKIEVCFTLPDGGL